MKSKLNVKMVVFAGVLVAMNIVLARVVAIPIGPTLRITISATPIYLAGLWFGPLVGGLCGGVSDILGCLLSGYAPNPFILVTSVLAGVIPGVLKKYVFQDKVHTGQIIVMIALHSLIGSMGFTTVGLHIYYGTPWAVLFTTRGIQTAALMTANIILVSILYQSVLTRYITQNVVCAGRKTV